MLWKDLVLNNKKYALFLMNLIVFHLLSYKKWMPCWHQVKFQVFLKDNNICSYCLNSNKVTLKVSHQMNRFTNRLSRMFKETYMLFLQWILIIQIFQIELLHHLLCSTGVLLIGLEIGLNKVSFKWLNNLLLL